MPEIDVTQAVKSAQEYLKKLYEGEAVNLRLEEVELADVNQAWHVTLSFTMPKLDPPIGHSVLRQLTDPLGLSAEGYPRYYKVFVIDALTGEPRSMKIRKM